MVPVESASSATPPPIQSDAYFSFKRAELPEDREATYRVRYQVYCLERGFLDRSDYPLELEQDAFDTHALHLLASHRDGSPAGTARLVMSSPIGFPLAGHCEFIPTHAFLSAPDSATLTGYAEISRLAVSRAFRRRDGDSFYGGPPRAPARGASGTNLIELPFLAPAIVTGLYRLLYQESKRALLTHWVGAMEPSLHLMLRRLGFLSQAIGPKVDYLGPVRPYVASIGAIENHLFRTSPGMLRYLAEGLEAELIPECLRDRDDSGEDLARLA